MLRDLLARLRAIESVEMAAVVASDGLLIESNASDMVDVEAVCAVASNSLAMAENLGREINKGGAVQTMLEYDEGVVLIEPISHDAMLLVLGNSRQDLGLVRFLTALHRQEMVEAVSAI
jgi:hypothetical protein